MKRTSYRRLVQESVSLLLCGLLLCAAPLSGLAQTRTAARPSTNSESKNAKVKPTSRQGKTTALKLGKLPENLRGASADGQIKGETFTGEPGITETVEQIMERERNTPKKPFDPNKVEPTKPELEYKPNKKPLPGSLDVPSFPVQPPDKPLPESVQSPQTIGTSIAGPGRNADGIGSIPPDSIGDVGPTQVLMHANGRIKVYDKLTGAVGGLDVTDSTFWTSVSGGVGISDPRVEYDRLSGRWFLCMINVSNTLNRVMIAVSSGPTITNTASFTFFQFATATQFLDYPTLGVDANALYIGGVIFSGAGSYASSRGYVINKANLLSNTLTVTTFNGLVASSAGAGPTIPQGVSNDDATFAEGYFIGADNAAFSLLQIRRVSTPGGVPTVSANIGVTVATTTFPLGGATGIGVPYQGLLSGRTLDDLDDRLFQAQITRDNVTGVSRLWTSHNIEVNTTGVADAAGNRNGSRWYEVQNLTATPTIIQSGTLFDSAAANPNSFWLPSVAVSGQGHMALGASSAGLARFPSLYAAGRLRTDTLGTTQAATAAQTSTTTYNLEGANTKQRWGDYSKTSVDPCDNQTFWTVGEYSDAADSWRMRAIQLRAAPPPATVTPAPATIAAGAASVLVVATGTSVSGTEFYDNPAGFVCNASCNTTGTGNCRMAAAVTASPFAAPATPLTVNSVTFNSPTQVTLNLNTVGATPGTHTIQITNPDGQTSSVNVQVNFPTAITAVVGGRITGNEPTDRAKGLRKVRVLLQGIATGDSAEAITDFDGYYTFPNTLVGQDVVVTPSRLGYTFSPATQLFSFVAAREDINFAGRRAVIQQTADNDFDGDGKTDFAVFRPADNTWRIRYSSNGKAVVETWGAGKDLLTPADFDGDGKTDLAVFRPREGKWYVKRSSEGATEVTQFGLAGDIPVAGDYDGDERADLAVFRAKEGVWLIRQSTDGQTRTVSLGGPGQRPLARDFDGDGRVDPTAYAPSEGLWRTVYSASSRSDATLFGAATDTPAPGDYDGDGKTDFALYRGASGAWLMQKSADNAGELRLFGVPGDKVVAGDYDGDGKTDFALFRPATSTWYVAQSDGGFTALPWGANGDYPAIPSHLR